MRKTPLLFALSVALAAAPVALAHPDAGQPNREKPTPAKSAQGSKGTLHLTHACVIVNATPTGVEVKTLSVNRHMRDALAGAPTLAAKIDPATTKIRLVGEARQLISGVSRLVAEIERDPSRVLLGDRREGYRPK